MLLTWIFLMFFSLGPTISVGTKNKEISTVHIPVQNVCLWRLGDVLILNTRRGRGLWHTSLGYVIFSL